LIRGDLKLSAPPELIESLGMGFSSLS